MVDRIRLHAPIRKTKVSLTLEEVILSEIPSLATAPSESQDPPPQQVEEVRRGHSPVSRLVDSTNCGRSYPDWIVTTFQLDLPSTARGSRRLIIKLIGNIEIFAFELNSDAVLLSRQDLSPSSTQFHPFSARALRCQSIPNLYRGTKRTASCYSIGGGRASSLRNSRLHREVKGALAL